MKAAVRRSYGSPKKIAIEDIEKPSPKEDEILIQVYATTVNRTDAANLRAKPFIMRFLLGFLKPKKIILGTDFAGKVVALGKNIKSFQINQRVFGFTDTGLASQAEYLTIKPEGEVLGIPDKINFNEAAASLEGAHYAYAFIHKVNIQPGQKILINGATGAIGSALLQFVNQLDVHITAVCDTKNKSLIRALGADKIYDYSIEDFTKDPEKYDFIFDAVGKSTFGKCKALLNEKGIYISSELGPYWQNLFFALLWPLVRKKKVIFPIPFKIQESINYIHHHLEKGYFKPVIDREYPLEKTPQAYEYVISGQKTGNVIVHIKSS